MTSFSTESFEYIWRNVEDRRIMSEERMTDL